MQKARGITFFSVIVVIVFIGIAIYLIVPRMMYGSSEQQLDQIRQDLNAIHGALDRYKLDNGAYPTSEQSLDALVTQPTKQPIPQYWNNKGYIVVIPVDPWGQPYQYNNNYEVIRVYSHGPRGKDGGSEIDITNIDKH